MTQRKPYRKIFSVYRGDKFVAVGTLEELCEVLGVSRRTLRAKGQKRRKNKNSQNFWELNFYQIAMRFSLGRYIPSPSLILNVW